MKSYLVGPISDDTYQKVAKALAEKACAYLDGQEQLGKWAVHSISYDITNGASGDYVGSAIIWYRESEAYPVCPHCQNAKFELRSISLDPEPEMDTAVEGIVCGICGSVLGIVHDGMIASTIGDIAADVETIKDGIVKD